MNMKTARKKTIRSGSAKPLFVMRGTAILAAMAILLVNSAVILAMDQARVESRTDLAASTFGESGQGVIVAILDRGIDWKNNDFRNADGLVTPFEK